ncbi:ketopantoate reductase family protein [Marinobacter pelagius]|uniref:ketopantoate reductase family protein n=1 Tax=Marinobacter sp. C7 TaxID=2951363 RepID=UPI001EF0CB28|nr:ketopantoate reductase family protein [Marinobacter sp. C7]MCG7200677.1 ketopantoate reductase family protein [Marinobacter sp. C7]
MTLKVLMIGAGGIGAYYAARLAKAGHDVVLTARGDHLTALQNAGLQVDYEGERLDCQLPSVDHPTLVQNYQPDDFDLVAVALKSTATGPVMEELGDWLRAGSVPVLSLQNGVDNEPMIADVVGENRVLGGLAVRIGGHIVEPGKVFAEGVAQIVMGAWPQAGAPDDTRLPLLDRLEGAFNEAGIPTTVTDDIRYELWRKLVINNGVNPLSALTGLDTRSLTHHPEFGKIVYGMMSETVEASKADGANLGQKDLDEMFDLISNFNAIKTSMLVDKEKGRPLELDSIAGAVLRRCERLDVSAPYTQTVNALLQFQESRGHSVP